MNTIKISDREALAIKRSLDWFEANTKVNPEGSIVKSSNDRFTYNSAIEVLNHCVPIDENIPERTRRKIIFATLIRWLKYRKYRKIKNVFKSFIAALQVEIRYFERRKSNFQVLMFLNINRHSLKELMKIKIMGDTMQFIDWEELNKFDIDKFINEIAFFDIRNAVLMDIGGNQPIFDRMKFSPILFKSNTYGPEAAIELAEDIVDVLRLMFNIPSVVGSYISFRSLPKAISKILPSPVFGIFDEHGRFISPVYYTIEKFDYNQIWQIPIDRVDSIKFLLEKLESKPDPKSSWNFVLNTLIQYQRALDIELVEPAYLAMWQVIENGVGLGERIRLNRDIEKRILSFVELTPIQRDMLHMLIQNRNDLVHSGTYPKRGDEIFFILKLITDAVIRSLINLANTFDTTTEMRDYIKYHSLSKEELIRKTDVIKKIEEFRKST